MLKADAEEAAPIAQNVLGAILASIATRGRSGADLRTAVGDFTANALRLIQTDQAGSQLANIFELTRKAGVTLPQLAHVRAVGAAESPRTLGAILVRNSLINFVLATEARYCRYQLRKPQCHRSDQGRHECRLCRHGGDRRL